MPARAAKRPAGGGICAPCIFKNGQPARFIAVIFYNLQKETCSAPNKKFPALQCGFPEGPVRAGNRPERWRQSQKTGSQCKTGLRPPRGRRKNHYFTLSPVVILAVDICPNYTRNYRACKGQNVIFLRMLYHFFHWVLIFRWKTPKKYDILLR